jgi:hypothetical protein
MSKKIIITNVFSLNMLNPSNWDCSDSNNNTLGIMSVSLKETLHMLNYSDAVIESAVGHKDTAAVFSSVLGREVACNRSNVLLDDLDSVLLVGQYTGPRLPEGAMELPEGAIITWWCVGIPE